MELSWQTFHKLEQDYGESFYILDIKNFEMNYLSFLESFRSIYSNTSIGYSYKTNYIPKICQLVNSLGGYAEVVSQMEYDLATHIGVPPENIIFNGPLKYEKDVEIAAINGSIINLDSNREVDLVKKIAQRHPNRRFGFGLRCNFDIGSNRISRFGFDVGNGDLEAAFTAIESLDNCYVAGLHCHFSTPDRSLDSYARRTQKMLDLSASLFEERIPRFINMGSGFFGNMNEELKQQFDYYIPSYQEYAEVIASQFASHFSGEVEPKLILEPGVALVADVLKFVAKVVGIKTIQSRRLALVVGSIHNIKPTSTDKQLPMKVYRSSNFYANENLLPPLDVVGYTCMEHDCLYKDYPEPISINDYIVFDNVGAYTIVFKPPFIRPNPAIVCYDSAQNEYSLARRPESTQDVFATYVI